MDIRIAKCGSDQPTQGGHQANIYRTDDNGGVSLGAMALAGWMDAGRREGYKIYYINLMFDQLPGSRDAVLHQMRKRIHKGFYSDLCRVSAHHPHSPGERHRLAEVIAFPDLPICKRASGALTHGNANGGFHYNGLIRIPHSSRLQGAFEDYVGKKAQGYRRHGFRVDVRSVDRSPEQLADYAAKTVKRDLAGMDDILVLPLSARETRRERIILTPDQKAIKEIESSTNWSPEFAWEVYMSLETHPGFQTSLT